MLYVCKSVSLILLHSVIFMHTSFSVSIGMCMCLCVCDFVSVSA